MIEIPQEFIEAWQFLVATQKCLPSTWREVQRRKSICDALVWALAGWNRERFDNIHGHFFVDDRCANCLEDGLAIDDERHTWTDEQWAQSVREGLEGAK